MLAPIDAQEKTKPALLCPCWFLVWVILSLASPTYVRAQSAWTALKSMSQARDLLAAVNGPDKKVYAIGGSPPGGGTLNIVEVYDPATDLWSAAPPMATTRNGPAAAAGMDGKIYVFGGVHSGFGGDSVAATVEAYNTKTRSWATVASMPTPRYYPTATRGRDGVIYVMGGSPSNQFGSSIVEAYNPQSNTWITLLPMPIARVEAGSATGPNGKIYVIGGAGGTANKSIEVYDPQTFTWTEAAPLPIGLSNCAASTGPDGMIYVIGGGTNAVQRYDTAANRWSILPPTTHVRSRTALVAGSDGRLYAIGGNENGNTFASVDASSFIPGDFAAGLIPNHGGNTGDVTTTVITPDSFPLAAGSTVKLTAPGQRDIVGVPVKLVNDNVLDVTFDLRGAPLGKRAIIVTNPESSTQTYGQAFTIEPGVAPQLATQVIGRTQLRAGAFSTYYVVVQNIGNTDSGSTDVRIQVPSYFTWQLSEYTAQDVFTGVNSTSYSVHVGSVPAASSKIVPVRVFGPDEPQYAHKMFNITAWDYSDNSPQITYLGDLTELLVLRTRTEDGRAVEFVGEYENGSVRGIRSIRITSADGKVITYVLDANGWPIEIRDDADNGVNISYPNASEIDFQPISAGKLISGLIKYVVVPALSPFPPFSAVFPALNAAGTGPCALANIARNLDKWLGFYHDFTLPLEATVANGESILESGLAMAAFQLAPYVAGNAALAKAVAVIGEAGPYLLAAGVAIVVIEETHVLDKIADYLDAAAGCRSETTSNDPNDLIGMNGYGTSHWTTTNRPLPYSVQFLNEPTAGAAKTVIITDHLDPTKFDLTTVSLGSVALVDRIVTPTPNNGLPVGNREFNADVNLSTKNLIARIHASLDMLTGDLTWTFLSIDPATGLPLAADDPNGFLGPGEEGSVSFSVLPKSGMPTGSIVTDSAVVVFDGKPLATPDWSNTLDNNKPTSIVRRFGNDRASLVGPPPVQTTTSFPVSWVGADIGSGVGGYTIEVSDNGGAFKPWLTNSTDTKATFLGRLGHLYTFRSTASDHAGNIEATHLLPDARTLVIRSDLMDVTDQLNVLVGPIESLRAKGIYEQSVRLTNTGNKISGPISVVLEGLSSKVSVAVVSGTTNTVSPAGSPYINLPTADLAPGATANLLMRFTAASKSDISYTGRVLAGPGKR